MPNQEISLLLKFGLLAEYENFSRAVTFAPEVSFHEAQRLVKMRDSVQDQILGEMQVSRESQNWSEMDDFKETHNLVESKV